MYFKNDKTMLTQKEINNLSWPFCYQRNRIWDENIVTKQIQGSGSFTDKFHLTFKKEIVVIQSKLLEKIEKEDTLQLIWSG